MSIKTTASTLAVIIMMSAPMTAVAQNLVHKDVTSPTTGRVIYTIPLPANWVVNTNPESEYFVTGPDGIKVYHGVSYKYFYGGNLSGYAQISGRQCLAPMSVGQYFEQIIKPYIQSQGHTFLKSYPLPEYVTLQEKFSAGMPNTGNRRSFQAIGTDWQTGPKETSMVAAVLTNVEGQAGTAWEVRFTQMEAPNSQFEAAKETVRYGTANSEIGRDHQDILNVKFTEFDRENKRKRAEIIRRYNECDLECKQMEHDHLIDYIKREDAISKGGPKARRDAFDSSVDRYRKNMDSYRKSTDERDGGQEKAIGEIRGEMSVSDSDSGCKTAAYTGSNNNWVSSNGEFIENINPNYDPNTDNSVNQDYWTRYEPED